MKKKQLKTAVRGDITLMLCINSSNTTKNLTHQVTFCTVTTDKYKLTNFRKLAEQ